MSGISGFRRTIIFLRWLFTPIALAFIAYHVLNQREHLSGILNEISSGYIVLSIGVYCLIHVLVPLVTKLLLDSESLGFYQLIHIHVNRIPARYLPGGIWQTVAKAADYNRAGVVAGQLARVTILEILLSLASVLFVGLMLLAGSNNNLVYVSAIPFGMSIVKMIVAPSVEDNRIIVGLSVYVLIWMLISLSFCFYLIGLRSELSDLAAWMGGYLLAWLVGYLAFFAPQGIGVTEVFFGWLRGTDSDAWVVLLFGFRLIMLMADMVTFGGARVLVFLYSAKKE